MNAHASHDVHGPHGLVGTLSAEPPATGQAVIDLTEGGRLVVPAEALSPRRDGGFDLPEFLKSTPADGHTSSVTSSEVNGSVRDAPPQLAAVGQPVTVPVIREEVAVDKRTREVGKVVVHIAPTAREEVVDLPLTEEHVDVERVPVNRFVAGPVAVREEGATTVIPVLEEVLVVEKRLLLKEEVRITRRRVTIHEPQRVVLRREEVHILRSQNPTHSGGDAQG